jgi:hypothetical protein
VGVIQKEIELAGSKGRKKPLYLILVQPILVLKRVWQRHSLQVGLKTAKKEEKLAVDKGGGLCCSDAKE